MKKQDLVEMIRVIVVEEVRKQLPSIVSEMFLRRIVDESLQHHDQPRRENVKKHDKKLSLEDVFEIEMNKITGGDEHVPEELENSDEGIYQTGVITRKNESVRSKLLSPNNPYATMFEDVVPIDSRGRAVAPLIPPSSVDDGGRLIASDVRQYGEFFKKMNEVASTKGPVRNTPEAEMRRLQQERAKLDAIKIG